MVKNSQESGIFFMQKSNFLRGILNFREIPRITRPVSESASMSLSTFMSIVHIRVHFRVHVHFDFYAHEHEHTIEHEHVCTSTCAESMKKDMDMTMRYI
jgi:hypothetical protein